MGDVQSSVSFQFEILSSLHPTPAVCGFPTDEARLLIAETGICQVHFIFSICLLFCFLCFSLSGCF